MFMRGLSNEHTGALNTDKVMNVHVNIVFNLKISPICYIYRLTYLPYLRKDWQIHPLRKKQTH